MPRLFFSKVCQGQGHEVKFFGTNRKVLPQGIKTCNMKALSLLVQKLWQRLSLLWTNRRTDRHGDSYIPPDFVCGGGGIITPFALWQIWCLLVGLSKRKSYLTMQGKRSKTRQRSIQLLYNYTYSCASVIIYNFNYHDINFPFMSSTMTSLVAGVVLISQNILYARACFTWLGCFEDFTSLSQYFRDIATWEQGITNLWNPSGETRVRTQYLCSARQELL